VVDPVNVRGRSPPGIGTNHDEGRTFAQYYATTSEKGHESSINASYGRRAAAVLARYPWKSFPAPYRTAYALAAAYTDSGFVGGIGGCATQKLAGELAARTPTFFYQFDDRHAPGLNHDFPGYRWGAGHQMELPFMWPSFNNGFSLYRQFNAGERELSGEMVHWWGAFVRGGAPDGPGQTAWPAYDGDATSGSVMSLRPAGASVVIPSSEFGAEHKCSFWDR
jgi:para-nitrobenzyl esterase